jgi:hypothetical protein
MNGECVTKQIDGPLTSFSILYDSEGVSRVQWATDTTYFSSTNYPSQDITAKANSFKFNEVGPLIGLFGTEQSALTSLGLIKLDTLCPVFNITEEEKLE